MADWAYSIIIVTVTVTLCKIILPKGEKSPLYAPIRFLLALILCITVFSPLVRLLGGDFHFKLPAQEETVSANTQQIILEKSEEDMKRHLQSVFPDTEFDITLVGNENYLAERVELCCHNDDNAQRIADYIKIIYQMDTQRIG